MAKQDFIPKRDGDLDAYEENFVSKFTLHAPTLGMDPAFVNEIKAGINSHRLAFSTMVSKRAESKSATEDNFNKKLSAINDLRRAARVIKSYTGYNTSIGDDLQIIGPDLPATDLSQLRPSPSVKVIGQIVYLKFTKGEADGVKIFSRRGSETEFSMLAFSTQSPYIDNRPKLNASQPETREYYMMYFVDMNEIGIVSDTIKALIQ